ncbi:MAG TPA: low-complexity protein, partial [Planktothrix sp. UBA10369]|nr:low-complexity protein [Planktothrix sp. UBA10369]
PGTDDRERRPSSGEFGPDEFTKLFQEAIDTVDLIFREGVDWRAFIYSFKKVQVENSETELTIQRIENKGDGVFIVRVQVPPEADKTKIHQNFTQTYQETLQTLETEYQEKLKIKDSEIANYRERSSNMTEVIRLLASREITQDRKFIKKSPLVAGKLVILKIIKGDFKTGFTVMLQLGQDGMLPSTEISGSLPPFPELEATYQQWKILYHKLQLPVRISGRKVNLFSSQDVCKDSAKLLEKQLKTWLKSEEFYPLKDRLQQKLNSTDEIRLILQTEHPTLLRLPWQVWEIFEHYPKAEIALSLPQYDQAESVNLNLPRTRVRILAILGNNQDINVHKD